MKSVFIIVLNWKRKDETLSCLESVEKLNSKKINLNTVIVDNNSQDGSVTAFKKYKAKNFKLHLVENKTNDGFAGGNNRGIVYALRNSADYILILNNDTRLDKNLVISLVKPFKSKKVGTTSPKIYFEKGYEFHKDKYKKSDLGKVLWAAGGKIDWLNVYGQNVGVDEVDKGQYDKKREIDFATGACLMVSSEAIKKLKGFNEKYFMYYEDVDLSVRLKKKGYKIIYVPDAVLWHKVAQSSGIGSGLNDYFISRNRLLFGYKYASLRTQFALFRESIKLLFKGRVWQRNGIYDYYMSNFYKGSWRN